MKISRCAAAASVDLDELRIPWFVLEVDSTKIHEVPNKIPKCPVLVFINTRSGGQLGGLLLQTFHELLDSHQVFDLSKEAPEAILEKVLRNLNSFVAQGDAFAKEIRKNLRLVVAGGDGTAGWLLGIMSDLRLKEPIPIATIPLGTGNNLPFSFGWGKKNPGTDVGSVKSFLADVLDAHPLKIDSWHLAMKMGGKKVELEAPHSLHSFKRSEESQEKLQIYRGGFWNYFSIGMDAQVSYEFHETRQQHPEKFKNQLHNQCTYAKLGCTQGWFCPTCRHHSSSRSINDIATVYIQDRHGNSWTELKISSSIRALVLLNLPSFSGGLDPWGKPNDKKSRERGLEIPRVDDGLLEIVGFRDAWHGMFLLLPNGHGTRLAQARRVKLVFKPGGYTFMRMDGEPWKQPLPEEDRSTEIEISHHGQAVMLAKEGCLAEAKNRNMYQHVVSLTRHGIEHGMRLKPVAPYNSSESSNSSSSSSSSNSSSSGVNDIDIKLKDDIDGTTRKFGAASTFKA